MVLFYFWFKCKLIQINKILMRILIQIQQNDQIWIQIQNINTSLTKKKNFDCPNESERVKTNHTCASSAIRRERQALVTLFHYSNLIVNRWQVYNSDFCHTMGGLSCSSL